MHCYHAIIPQHALLSCNYTAINWSPVSVRTCSHVPKKRFQLLWDWIFKCIIFYDTIILCILNYSTKISLIILRINTLIRISEATITICWSFFFVKVSTNVDLFFVKVSSNLDLFFLKFRQIIRSFFWLKFHQMLIFFSLKFRQMLIYFSLKFP